MAEPKYFRMTCYDAPAKVTLTGGLSTLVVTLEYKLNDGAWGEFNNEAGVDLNPGDYVEFRGTNVRLGVAANNYKTFTITGEGKIKLSGDITTLLELEGNVTQLATNQTYCFAYLFANQTNIIDAGDMLIPIEQCSGSCFYYMFSGSGITRAPYTKITKTARNSMSYMFNTCRNLSYIKFGGPSSVFGSTISPAWLYNVAADGIFEVEDPNFNMDIQRSASSVPVGWTLRMAGEGGLELYLNGNKVKTVAINGKTVKTLFINGGKVLWQGEPPPPSFKI